MKTNNTIPVVAAFIAVCLGLAPILLSMYGLILAWNASILLFFVVLLIEPSPLILGVIAVLGHPEVAHKIAQALGLS